MRYPKEVYSINEDITRRNMAAYDARQAEILAKCLEIAPDYYSQDLMARHKIRKMAEK